ncbi:MAG: Mov34/MPN/PAD-1 family protein [Nannocystaceae bacterium]
MHDPETPPLSLSNSVLEDMYRHARATFPRECCGYLIADADAGVVVQRCENIQDELHAEDPETFPRTAENGYNIGGRELLSLVRSFGGPRPATIIYHSHPRVGAYFSAEDERAAEAAGYPVDYLVIDAQEDRIGEAKLFKRRTDAGDGGPLYEVVATFPGASI